MDPSPKPPVDLELLTSLAKRFAERDLFAEADELFQLALRLAPHNMGIQLNLAELRKHRRQSLDSSLEDAAEALREEHRRNAIDAAHFFGLAALYDERGRPELAAECLEIACDKENVNPFAHKLNGRLLFQRKDYDGARDELRTARRYNPFDREIADLLGRVEYEREHYAEALEATIDAFLLIRDDDRERADALKKRIRELKTLRRLSSGDLVQLFRDRREVLQTAFDRLELRRERFLARQQDTREIPTLTPRARGGRLEMARRLRALDCWTHLDDEQIFHLTRAVREERCEAGAAIFTYGGEGIDVYVLEEGEVAIRRPTSYGVFELGRLGAGSLFGEANFITRGHRIGDAVAVQGCRLLRVDAEKLEALFVRHPELGVAVFTSFWHGLAQKLRHANEQLRSFFSDEERSEKIEKLRRAQEVETLEIDAGEAMALLREQGLSGGELETLANFSNVKRYPSGTFLFHEGDPGQEMYVVLEGKVMISKYIPGGGEEALAILRRGDFFGEMALIDGEPRSADARACEGPATLVAFDEETLSEVMAMDPGAGRDFMELLCRLICKRLAEIDEKVTGWRIMAGGETALSHG